MRGLTEVLIPSPSSANSSTALMTLGLGSKLEEAFGPTDYSSRGLGKQGACWLVGTRSIRRPWLGRPRLAESLGQFATILYMRCLWCLTARSRHRWPHLP